MRFQVPQFIEVEDKIFGPLTLKQFIYIAGGAGLSFVLYVTLKSLLLAIIPIIVVMAFALALAFFKLNNKPFINVVESALRYWVGHKLYVWHKNQPTNQPQSPNEAIDRARKYTNVTVPRVTDSKLKDLRWSIDIKETKYSADK